MKAPLASGLPCLLPRVEVVLFHPSPPQSYCLLGFFQSIFNSQITFRLDKVQLLSRLIIFLILCVCFKFWVSHCGTAVVLFNLNFRHPLKTCSAHSPLSSLESISSLDLPLVLLSIQTPLFAKFSWILLCSWGNPCFPFPSCPFKCLLPSSTNCKPQSTPFAFSPAPPPAPLSRLWSRAFSACNHSVGNSRTGISPLFGNTAKSLGLYLRSCLKVTCPLPLSHYYTSLYSPSL